MSVLMERRMCSGYTVDRRTVNTVLDHLEKEQKLQLLTVRTSVLQPDADPAGVAGLSDVGDAGDADVPAPVVAKVVLVTVPGVTAEDERVRRVLGRWSQLQAEKAEGMKRAIRRQNLLACESPVEVMVIRLLGVMFACYSKGPPVTPVTQTEPAELAGPEAPAIATEVTVEQVLEGSPVVRWVCLYGHQNHPEVVEKEEVCEEVKVMWKKGLEEDLRVLNVAAGERDEK